MTDTCIVCGTTDSGVPGFGMAISAFNGYPTTWYACKAHADSVQLVPDGYDRHKTPQQFLVRPMRVAEAKLLWSGQHVKMIALDGTLRTVKVNGKPQTWKTRPNEVRVPVKYGLYATGQLTQDGDTGLMQQLVVVIDESESAS